MQSRAAEKAIEGEKQAKKDWEKAREDWEKKQAAEKEKNELEKAETILSGSDSPPVVDVPGLATAGTTVWLEPNNDPKKKLKFGWRLVEHNNHMICIDTTIANMVVKEALEKKELINFIKKMLL